MSKHRAIWVALAVGIIVLAMVPARAFADGDDPLVELQFDIVGIRLEVDPPALTVPKNIATQINNQLVVPAEATAETENALAAFVEGAEVLAELRGPGIPPIELRVAPGQPIPIPPLALPGDYFLDRIRLVKGGEVILDGVPNVVPIRVIAQVFVTSVTSRPLDIDEIRSKGIIIDENNFDAFNFQLAFNIDNIPFKIDLPVALPTREFLKRESNSADVIKELIIINQQLAETQEISLPEEFDRPGLNFSVAALPFIPAKLEDEGEIPFGAPPITGLILIPGNIAHLNQHFSVLLMVANVAPENTTLVLDDVEAEITLPFGLDRVAGTFSDPGDDPLRLARIEGIGQQPIVSVVQVEPDDTLGTADDLSLIPPQAMGEGEFLVEGLAEGSHTLNIEINATLLGLPSGPVELVGQAVGSVFVRDPTFDITLSHPRTVRVGEPYDLYATITNTSSETTANLVTVTLNDASISGAILAPDTEESVIFETLAPGESATAKWGLISQQTGNVTFSSFTSEPGVTGRFKLRTGIGERGVPLAPNAIVLPATTSLLPPDLVFAAVRVLGQALSIAQAPAGSLPADVLFVRRQTIIEHGRELAEAGQRIRFGEPLTRVINDLLLDWLGSNLADDGFDQILRDTNAGASFIAEVAKVVNDSVTSSSVLDAQEAMARATVPRAPHVSAITGSGPGSAPVQLRITDDAGNITGQDDIGLEFSIPFANLFNLQSNGGRADLAVVARTESTSYTIDVLGTGNGVFDLGVVLPTGVGELTQLRYEGVAIENGGSAQVVINLANGNTFALRVDRNGDGVNDETIVANQVTIVEGPPQILTVRQMESSFFESGGAVNDPATHGLLVGVLFDKPVTEESAEVKTNYNVEANSVGGAQLQRSERLVYLYLDKPVGNLVPRSITIQDVADLQGRLLAPVTLPIVMVLDEGAHVFGQVRQADGTPVPNSILSLTVIFGNSGFTVATILTDTEGGYDFDYITALGDGIVITAQDPISLDFTTLRAKIRAPGEMLLLNPTFRGKGAVRGLITDANGDPVTDAKVLLFPSGFNRAQGANPNALGEYVISDAPVGTYTVFAVDNTGAFGESAGVIETAGAEATTDIVLFNQPETAGRLTGRVFLSNGEDPAVGFDVFVGSYDRRQSKIDAIGQTTTDEAGSFTFESIRAGIIDVVAVDPATQQLGVSIGTPIIAQVTN